MTLHVRPRRALACLAAGGSFPLAFWTAWIVAARYARRQGL